MERPGHLPSRSAALGLVVLFEFLVLVPLEPGELTAPAQRKTRVGNGQAHAEETAFIGRLHREHLVGIARTVDVGIGDLARQAVATDDFARIAVEVFGIGFQIDPSVRSQQAGVEFQKERRSEPFFRPAALELGIGKGDPDFGDLALGEKPSQELHTRAQKPYVGHPSLGRSLGTAPHASPLDVDADVVAQRIALGQSDGVFALAAAQLQHDGPVVLEEVAVPVPLHGVVAAEYVVEFGLQEAGEPEIFAEFAEFVFSHLFTLYMESHGFDALHRAGGRHKETVVAAPCERRMPAIAGHRFAVHGRRSAQMVRTEKEGLFEAQRIGRAHLDAQGQRIVAETFVITQEERQIAARHGIGVRNDDLGRLGPLLRIDIRRYGTVNLFIFAVVGREARAAHLTRHHVARKRDDADVVARRCLDGHDVALLEGQVVDVLVERTARILEAHLEDVGRHVVRILCEPVRFVELGTAAAGPGFRLGAFVAEGAAAAYLGFVFAGMRVFGIHVTIFCVKIGKLIHNSQL